ncbi:GNAT family N-acetyltransferase [Spirosoma migulaei]
MHQPPFDLHPKARKVVDAYEEMRRSDAITRACYRDLPPSNRLQYELLDWHNYRVLLDLFSQDTNPFVMSSLKEPEKLDEYVAYQLAIGRYSGKRGMCDWFLRLADGTYVGILHLYDVSFELWEGKRFPCMCGYAIAEPFRRQGYAYEALSQLLSRLPEDFKLFKARAEPLEANVASRALLEKVGFRFEKTFKNYWGEAALYNKKLVKRTPRLSWKEFSGVL